jgi:hypothetical protein
MAAAILARGALHSFAPTVNVWTEPTLMLLTLLGLLHFVLIEGGATTQGMQVRPAAHLATAVAALPLVLALAQLLFPTA